MEKGAYAYILYLQLMHAGVPNSFPRGLQLYKLICKRLIPNFLNHFMGRKYNQTTAFLYQRLMKGRLKVIILKMSKMVIFKMILKMNWKVKQRNLFWRKVPQRIVIQPIWREVITRNYQRNYAKK